MSPFPSPGALTVAARYAGWNPAGAFWLNWSSPVGGASAKPSPQPTIEPPGRPSRLPRPGWPSKICSSSGGRCSSLPASRWASGSEEYLQNPAWKTKTRADYEDYLHRFALPHLGHLRLQELTPARVQQWIHALRATPYQRAKALHYFKLCLNRAVDLELIKARGVGEL